MCALSLAVGEIGGCYGQFAAQAKHEGVEAFNASLAWKSQAFLDCRARLGIANDAFIVPWALSTPLMEV